MGCPTTIPTVSHRDEVWYRKYGDDTDTVDDGVVVTAPSTTPPAIHMPSPSFYPLVIAVGLPLAAYGVLFAGPIQIALLAAGGIVVFAGITGWVLEPSTAPE